MTELFDVLRSENYLILDTETTGVDSLSEIVSIAVINAKGETLMDTLVRPVQSIPASATAIHGISDAHVKDAEMLPYNELVAMLNGKQVVVYNADYDSAMLYRSMRAAGFPYIDWSRIATWHCAMKEFARIYKDYDFRRKSYRWKKLSLACEYYKIPVVDAHNALADCQATLKVCQAMIGIRPLSLEQSELPF